MSRSCVEALRVGSILILVCAAGAGAARCDASSQSILDEATAFMSRGLDETGGAEAQGERRDEAVRIASAVDSVLKALEPPRPSTGLPGATIVSLLDAWSQIAGRALLHEAARLDAEMREGRAGDGSTFRALWNWRTNRLLAALERWPGLWTRTAEAGGSAFDAVSHLLLFCAPEAYRGEAFSLPRRHLLRRMADLPDSIARCCLDDADCRRRTGAGCVEGMISSMARQPDLQMLVGFVHMDAYWDLPSGRPPRSPADDAMVAHAEVRAAERLVASTFPQGEALPEGLDPTTTVPGLRNPRRDGDGRVAWDLILHRQAREIYERTWGDARLRGLGSGGRRVDSDSISGGDSTRAVGAGR